MIHLVIYQSFGKTEPLSFLDKLTGPILLFVALALFRKIHAPVFWNMHGQNQVHRRGQTDRWTDRQMDRQTDRQKDRLKHYLPNFVYRV